MVSVAGRAVAASSRAQEASVDGESRPPLRGPLPGPPGLLSFPDLQSKPPRLQLSLSRDVLWHVPADTSWGAFAGLAPQGVPSQAFRRAMLRGHRGGNPRLAGVTPAPRSWGRRRGAGECAAELFP